MSAVGARGLWVFFIIQSAGIAEGGLAELTQNTAALLANQAELYRSYCPTGVDKCDEDPSKILDISTIGGLLFVCAVGLAVGTDVTKESLIAVVKHSKRGFAVGMLCQFGFMPFYAFLFTFVFKSDLTSSSFYTYEASVLGVMIVGCLPGGNTSNLFTWFCGGNVSLSILMSLVSNLAALGMLPLMLYLYYQLRFPDGEEVPAVPYTDIMIPLAATIGFVVVGMLIKAKAGVETIWWTAKISSLVALVFLFLAVVTGIAKYPHIVTSASYSMYLWALTAQPMGYVAGWIICTIFRVRLRDTMTIAFETGVQSFTLGLVMAQLGFNSETEACQFDPRCMSLITGLDTDRYEFSWSGDGRIAQGSKVGQISTQGFLPGQAGTRTTGGCCRYNELVYLDVFKFSAMCGIFYVVHAFWMIKLFRKVFPNGFLRSKFVYVQEEGEPSYCRNRVVLPNEILEPAFLPSGVGSSEVTPPITLPDLLKQAAARCGKEWALGVESPVEPFVKGKTFSKSWDQWRRWTWAEYNAEVEQVANAFKHIGLEPHGTVAIYGFNAPEWNISALAAMLVGGKCCGIYPTDTVDQVIYKLEHSNTSIAVIDDNKKLKAFTAKSSDDSVPSVAVLKAIVMYGSTPECQQVDRQGSTVPVHPWSSMAEISQKSVAGPPHKIDPGSACCLVYTSGTTGMPKAVMLSHDNVCFTSRGFLSSADNRVGVDYSQERVLSYLPLSHIAGFAADIVLPLTVTARTKGFCTVYAARPYDLKEGSLKDRLTFVRPTLFLGVPRVYEKFHEGIKAVGERTAKLTGIKAQMPILCCIRKTTAARWAKNQGLLSAKALQYGGSGRTSTFLGLADGMILSKIRAALGLDACKLCATGAAPIMYETIEAFGSYGIQVNEVYGMSESTGYATLSTNERHLWQSCGYPSPGSQVRILKTDQEKTIECPKAEDIANPTEEEQGEICFRGRHIMMGYLANPQFGTDHVDDIKKKTAEAIDDLGWLHSGDKGCMGKNGFVRITGRFKELIITAGGENVAPVPIEDNIKAICPAISFAAMIGDKRKYNTVLVTLKASDGETLDKDAILVPGVETVSAAMGSEEYKAVIQQAIEATNQNSKVCASNACKVQKFAILPNDFTVDGEELTPTMKMRRKIIETKYAEHIAKLYA